MTPDQMGAQGSWITQQFSGSTYVPNNMDVQYEPIYDTLWDSSTGAPYAAGATIPSLSQFFTAPGAKTYAQTNVTTAKRLDAPQAFAVMAICFRIGEDILLADMIALYKNFALELWIGEKSYNRAPLWRYPAGGGVTGFSNLSNESALVNGVAGQNGQRALQINIVIDNQASFYGQLDGSPVTLTAAASGGTGANLMMLLDGLHARGVQ